MGIKKFSPFCETLFHQIHFALFPSTEFRTPNPEFLIVPFSKGRIIEDTPDLGCNITIAKIIIYCNNNTVRESCLDHIYLQNPFMIENIELSWPVYWGIIKSRLNGNGTRTVYI